MTHKTLDPEPGLAEEIPTYRGTKSEIGALLQKKFTKEIRFSNKLFRSSHQEMSWKLAGATNLFMQRNLISSKVTNLLLQSYISKAFFSL